MLLCLEQCSPLWLVEALELVGVVEALDEGGGELVDVGPKITITGFLF